MFFNNNLGGTYRNRNFEYRIIDYVNEVAPWDKPVVIFYKFFYI